MPEPILEADNVVLRFGDFTALSGVSLSVAPNTIHALIGPNGAGKTTFFNVLTGIRRPNRGRVSFAGRDVTRMPAHRRLNRGMARSFQVTNLYPLLSVAENMRLAVQARHGRESWVFWRPPSGRPDIVDEADAVLDRIGLADRRESRAGDLSHGAQRLLEIGLAIASRPNLIFLDEPLAGMGLDDVVRTKEMIVRLREEMTVLLIEHNMGVVLDISNRVTVLAQGRIIADDVPERVRVDPAVRAAYLGSGA